MDAFPDATGWLQTVIDRSIEQAGPFLRRSFEFSDHALSAAQVVRHLTGLPTVALATVTARGEPRVAPIGAFFVEGRFHIPTVANAARTRHLRARPAVSLTYYEGIDLAILVHGHASIITTSRPTAVGAPAFDVLDATYLDRGGSESVREWGGEGVFLRVEPALFYTYARYPDRFPG